MMKNVVNCFQNCILAYNFQHQNLTTQYQKSKVYQNPVQYKLTFITLTLPSKQIHSDNEIKSKCLNQFLIELKKNHSVSRYIWKAEKQENNNIHFHIIADKFIKWQYRVFKSLIKPQLSELSPKLRCGLSCLSI